MIETAGARNLVDGFAEVPFPRHIGTVPSRRQHFRQGHVIVAAKRRQRRARHGRRLLRVESREHRNSGRATARRHVVVSESGPRLSELVDVGCADFAAVGAQIRKPHVVEQHDQHVGARVAGRTVRAAVVWRAPSCTLRWRLPRPRLPRPRLLWRRRSRSRLRTAVSSYSPAVSRSAPARLFAAIQAALPHVPQAFATSTASSQMTDRINPCVLMLDPWACRAGLRDRGQISRNAQPRVARRTLARRRPIAV